METFQGVGMDRRNYQSKRDYVGNIGYRLRSSEKRDVPKFHLKIHKLSSFIYAIFGGH